MSKDRILRLFSGERARARQIPVRIKTESRKADFLVSEWTTGRAPDRPRKPLDSKSQMGCGNRAPEDWIGEVMDGPPWDSKDLTADQNRRYRSFTEGGG